MAFFLTCSIGNSASFGENVNLASSLTFYNLGFPEDGGDGGRRGVIGGLQGIANFGLIFLIDGATELRGVVTVGSDEFEGELFLENQVDGLGRVVGLDELVKDGGAEMEGWVGEDLVGLGGEVESEEVLRKNPNVVKS